MIEFHPVTLQDKEWVDRHLMWENSPSADFNFGNMFIWDETYHQRLCRFGERTLTMFGEGPKPAFAFPAGRGPLRPAVDALRAFAASKGFPFVMYGVTERSMAQLEEEYPGCFAFTEDEAYADYIYEAEKLATYAGKALHGKKNHCNRFEAEHEWSFVPLTRELSGQCLEMVASWTVAHEAHLGGVDAAGIVSEHKAIERAFACYDELGLEGGVLFAEGQMMGFTFGEMTSPDTFDVHVEKAAADVNGAYPMVCRELTRMLMERHPELVYINREDDTGSEALRQSKLSYKPAFLLRKFSAEWTGA